MRTRHAGSPDRGVRLETHVPGRRGADRRPEARSAAAMVGAVLDALSAPAGRGG